MAVHFTCLTPSIHSPEHCSQSYYPGVKASNTGVEADPVAAVAVADAVVAAKEVYLEGAVLNPGDRVAYRNRRGKKWIHLRKGNQTRQRLHRRHLLAQTCCSLAHLHLES